MKNLIFSLSIILLLTAQIFCQENIKPKEEAIELDSCLINGNIVKANNYFTLTDSLIKTGKFKEGSIKRYKAVRQMYNDMLNKMNFRINLDSLELHKYIDQYRLMNQSFKKEVAGKLSCRAYKKFIKNAEKNEFKEAIKYYSIAYFFMERYIYTNNSEIMLNYNSAYTNYRNGNYQDALKLYEYVQSIATDRHLYKSINDSVKFFIKQTKEKIGEKKFLAELWNQKDVVDFHVLFTAGININYQPAIGNPDWVLSNHYGNVIEISKIPSTFSSGFSYTGDIYIWKGILLGGQYNTAKMMYDPITRYYIIGKPDCNITYTSYSISGKYLFRQEAGLRPYAGLGFGEIKISKSGVYGVTDKYGVKYDSPPVDVSSPQYMLQFGIEYIFNKSNNVMLNFMFNVFNAPQSNKILTNTYYSTGLELGVVI